MYLLWLTIIIIIEVLNCDKILCQHCLLFSFELQDSVTCNIGNFLKRGRPLCWNALVNMHITFMLIIVLHAQPTQGTTVVCQY